MRSGIWRFAVAPSNAASKKLQYRCTTTITQVDNSPKVVLENLLPVWLLVRTNLFIPSRFWTITEPDLICSTIFHLQLFFFLFVLGRAYVNTASSSSYSSSSGVYYNALVAYSGGFRESDFPRQDLFELDVLRNRRQLLRTAETRQFAVLTSQVHQTHALFAPVSPQTQQQG